MPSILIFCIGDRTHGMGHVQRQIVLARELMQRGVDVTFETPSDTPGYARIADAGFRVVNLFPRQWIALGADACIVDMEHGPELAWLETVRETYRRIIIFGGVGFTQTNGPDVLSRLCDAQFYQGELFDLPYGDGPGLTYNGPSYVIINPDYAKCTPDHDGPIIVSLGGSDPHNLTGPCLNALAGIGRPILAVIGPAADFSGFFQPNVEIIRSPESLVSYLDGAAVCVTATGMTAYESLCAGVPVVLTNWSEDHKRTAGELVLRGAAHDIGLWSEFDPLLLLNSVSAWLRYSSDWRRASEIGRSLIDGLGAGRVADRICALL